MRQKRVQKRVSRKYRVALAVAISLPALIEPTSAEAGGHPRGAFDGVWGPDRIVDKLLTTDGQGPPLTEAAVDVYAKHVALKSAGDLSFDRTSWCAGPGMPRIMFMAYPFEIRAGEDRVAFIYSWYRWYRVIDMSSQRPEIPLPLTMGFPVGKWDGDTLIVRTEGLSDTTILDASGLPHSDNMVLTERLRLLPDGHLEDTFTIEDPANYTQPWTTSMTYHRRPEAAVADDVCPDRIARGEPAVREKLQ